MSDFLVALGLVCVIEGLFLAAFPRSAKRSMVAVLSIPNATLRVAGIAAALFGILIVWLVRH